MAPQPVSASAVNVLAARRMYVERVCGLAEKLKFSSCFNAMFASRLPASEHGPFLAMYGIRPRVDEQEQSPVPPDKVVRGCSFAY